MVSTNHSTTILSSKIKRLLPGKTTFRMTILAKTQIHLLTIMVKFIVQSRSSMEHSHVSVSTRDLSTAGLMQFLVHMDISRDRMKIQNSMMPLTSLTASLKLFASNTCYLRQLRITTLSLVVYLFSSQMWLSSELLNHLLGKLVPILLTKRDYSLV